MTRPDLATLFEELEALSRHFPASLDAYGTLTLIQEGGYGGREMLLWAPWEAGPEVLRAVADLDFKGRMVVALAPLFEDQTPFVEVLKTHAPRYAFFLHPERGIAHRFPGFKEVVEGGKVLRVPLTDPRPPRRVARLAPTGLRYFETRLFPPWESPSLDGARPSETAPLGSVAKRRGALPYALGRETLGRDLRRALRSLNLLPGD